MGNSERRSDEGGSGSARRGRIGRVASHLTVLRLEGPCCVAIQRRTCIYKYIHLHLTNSRLREHDRGSASLHQGASASNAARTLQNDVRQGEKAVRLCCYRPTRWVAVLGRNGPQRPVLSGQTMMFILGALARLSSWMV